MHSFYGMPWEIFRTDTILDHTKRPVTFVTKSGGLPSYFSIIIVLPEYDLGVTILVAGQAALLVELRETVTVLLVRAAEAVAQKSLATKYAGSYSASTCGDDSGLNSSITLAQSPHGGLYVESWISNGTDLMVALGGPLSELVGDVGDWRAQLVPTLLFRDEEKQAGEVWRLEIVSERTKAPGQGKVWDDFCMTYVDNTRYAGVPLNEVVFWSDHGDKNTMASGVAAEIELPAYRVRMRRQEACPTEQRRGSTGPLVQVQKTLMGSAG
jgi:hypothetical protein